MWHCCVLNERELLLSNCYTFNGEIEVFKIYFSHYCTSTCRSAINSLVAVSNLAGASVGQIRFRVVVEDLASKSDLVLLQLVDVILKLGKFRIQRLLFRSQLDILLVVEGCPGAVGGVGVVSGARGAVGGRGGGGGVPGGGRGVGAAVRVTGHSVHHVEQGQTEEQLQQ